MRNLSYENEFSSQVHSNANSTHFHMKGFALELVLKQRQKATQKWPIVTPLNRLRAFSAMVTYSIHSLYISQVQCDLKTWTPGATHSLTRVPPLPQVAISSFARFSLAELVLILSLTRVILKLAQSTDRKGTASSLPCELICRLVEMGYLSRILG